MPVRDVEINIPVMARSDVVNTVTYIDFIFINTNFF